MLAKRRAIAGGRTDVELTDHIGILAANDLIDTDMLMTLRLIERWLSQVRRAHGIADGHVGRLWAQLLAGVRGGRIPVAPANARRTQADVAWALGGSIVYWTRPGTPLALWIRARYFGNIINVNSPARARCWTRARCSQAPGRRDRTGPPDWCDPGP